MRTFCTESRRIPNRKAINFGGGTVPNPGSRLVEVKKHFALIAVRIGHANQLFFTEEDASGSLLFLAAVDFVRCL